MQGIEFNAKIENGVIQIPSQYKNSIAGNVRVIVLFETNIEKSKKKELHYFGIDMTGYKFDREEANARR
jgi:hypothetical protein